MNALQKAALERAKRTAIEYICSSIPVGIVVTPAMIQNFDFDTVKYVIAAWVCTGVIQVVYAYFWALKCGLPEVQPAEEMTSAEAAEMPVVEYNDVENYDDLRIDDSVDEGEDDEMEQED